MFIILFVSGSVPDLSIIIVESYRLGKEDPTTDWDSSGCQTIHKCFNIIDLRYILRQEVLHPAM